jgi:serine/threonine protein kinase
MKQNKHILQWYANGDVGSYIRRHSVTASQRFEWVRVKIILGYEELTCIKWCEIIEGVAYLHSHEPVVIHGDLKPVSVSYLELPLF